MFERLQLSEPDVLGQMIVRALKDTRAEKLDFGVGVYVDDTGTPPIMTAVKQAEKQVLGAQTHKSYPGMTGDQAFCETIAEFLCPGSSSSIAACQTVGGSGALRILSDVLATAAGPDTTLWMPKPTWPNHAPLLHHPHWSVQPYCFTDNSVRSFCLQTLRRDLATAKPGDVILLHACCHNPTGIDPNDREFDQVVDLIRRAGLVPLIDLAYLGYGAGLTADLGRLNLLVDAIPELAIAFSASKSFGVYCDRVGAALVKCTRAQDRDAVNATMIDSIRQSYSMPPTHGAAVVRRVLQDPELRHGWQTELEGFRERLVENRAFLNAAFLKHGLSDLSKGLLQQRGMFATLGLADSVVEELRVDHAVYLGPAGRINLSGLSAQRADRLAGLLASCLASHHSNHKTDVREPETAR